MSAQFELSFISVAVRDLEGRPNCRVSECQEFITKQRYKRVVIFACDLTTRTERQLGNTTGIAWTSTSRIAAE